MEAEELESLLGSTCTPVGSGGACKLVIIMKVFTPWGELSFSLAASASWHRESAAQTVAFKGPPCWRRRKEPRNKCTNWSWAKSALKLLFYFFFFYIWTFFLVLLLILAKSDRRDASCQMAWSLIYQVSTHKMYPHLCNFGFYAPNFHMPQRFLSFDE